MLDILFAGIAPGIALLTYFYLKDKYKPEPVIKVFLTFIFGAILVLPTSFIEYVLEKESIIRTEFASASFSLGMLEELFKWSILIFIVYRHAKFNEPFDGIVYGASVSLGFATAENIMYLMSNGLEYALHRALLPVSSHALFGVIMGYYVSVAKFITESKWTWMILSIVLPSILHGIFNYILLSLNWLITMLIFMIFLWWFGLRKVQMAEILSKKHFEKQFSF